MSFFLTFTTKQFKISSKLKLKANIGIRTQESVVERRIIGDDRTCQRRNKVRGKISVDLVVDVYNIVVLLREFDGVFRVESGQLLFHPFSNSKYTSFWTRESILVYK